MSILSAPPFSTMHHPTSLLLSNPVSFPLPPLLSIAYIQKMSAVAK